MPALRELRLEQITTSAALQQLAPAWQRLWQRVPQATPFQSPAWLLPWWLHLGEGTLLTLAFHRAEDLVGLLPCYVYTAGDGRGSLFPLGIGTTDYLDALVLPDAREAVLAAASRHLAVIAAQFDCIDWPQLREGAVLAAMPPPPGWAEAASAADPGAVLSVPEQARDLRGVISQKTLRDLKTARRRASAIGTMPWQVADPESLDTLFDGLLRLHAARWQGRGEAGVLAEGKVQAMHRAALPLLLRSGLLYMPALRHAQGDIIAVLYALADPPRPKRCLYLYLSGFDPAQERISPGMLLIGQALDHAVAAGFAHIDFLRGRERYKSFWGAQESPTLRRQLLPPGPEARA